MSRIFEFRSDELDKKSIINEIKILLYYDETWLFPVIGFDIMEESLNIKINQNIKDFTKSIVNEMNKRNVDADDWEKSFNDIIKNL